MDRYPTRNGVAISPYELSFSPSRLDLSNEYNFNLHHAEFTRREFGRFALLDTFRSLSSNQYILPIDTHAELHRLYNPPDLPTPEQAMDRIQQAVDSGEPLRYGSALHPEYRPIGKEILRLINREYLELR